METMPSERARQENAFFCFKEDRFDIRDTPRSGRPLGFDEDRLKINPKWSTSVYSLTGKCDEL